MNLRREARAKTLAKWQAQGPAIIERPLRLVAHACEPTFDANGNLADPGDPWLLRQAIDAARRGDGILVKDIARVVLR